MRFKITSLLALAAIVIWAPLARAQADLDDPEVFEKIVGEAADIEGLEARGPEGAKLHYEQGTQVPYTGWAKGVHPDGSLGMLGFFRKGKAEGTTLFWLEDGIKMKAISKAGKLDGPTTSIYPNGRKATEGTFKNNELEGRHFMWYPSGQNFAELNYKDGKLDGPFTRWDESGGKIEEGVYKDGLQFFEDDPVRNDPENLGKNKRELLLQKSADYREATIVAVSGRYGSSVGCFIGDDGLAVFGLWSFTGSRVPEKYLLAGETALNAPTLRYIAPEIGIAIAKFDYRPKIWIEPSAEPLRLGEQVAIVDAVGGGSLAVGPVTSNTKGTVANYRHPILQPEFGIGTGLPAGRNEPPDYGSPIIDSNGRLRGIFRGAFNTGSQILLYGVSTDHWFAGIAEARKVQGAIPIPVPPNLDPFDPAQDDPDYTKAVLAAHQGQSDKAVEHVKRALKRHPNSSLLHSLHFEEANMAGRIDDLIALAEATKPRGEEDLLGLVKYHAFLSKALRRTGDHEGAGAALRAGLDIAPKELWSIREEYAGWLESDDKPEEALRYLQEAATGSPDNIQLLEKQRNLLIQLGKEYEEAERKLSERIFELENLYRATSSASLRPNRK